jgi:hypothetical protein
MSNLAAATHNLKPVVVHSSAQSLARRSGEPPLARWCWSGRRAATAMGLGVDELEGLRAGAWTRPETAARLSQ